MLFEFSVFFILFSLSVMFFVLISAHTQNLHASDAERLDTLHEFLVLKIVPVIIAITFFLMPTIIIYGV
jgi:hypothetical protein